MARLYTYKITLSNTTSTATPPNLQVRLNINFASLVSNINADLGNIRFSSDQAGNNLLYAWLESAPQGTFTQSSSLSAYTSSNVWVNLGNNIIPANGSLIIYMQVLSNGTEFDGIYWGANPLWTNTYGQYDNGANVFNFYDNFAGTSLKSVWTVPSGSNYKVDNGFIATPSGGSTTAVYNPSIQETSSIITEWDLNLSSTTFPNNIFYFQLNRYTPNSNMHFLGSQGSDMIVNNNTGIATETILSTGNQIFGVWNDGTTVTWYYPTSSGESSYTDTSATAVTDYVSLGWTSSSDNFPTIYWVRTRVYPPNGTDPVLTSISLLLVGNYTSASTPVPEWSTLNSKPYVIVSAKGISNGLSNIPNDGADFGPDTLLGASSPSQYGPPYTQTSGIQEAINYVTSLPDTMEIVLLPGTYNITAPFVEYGTAPSDQNPTLPGRYGLINVMPVSSLNKIKIISIRGAVTLPMGSGGSGELISSSSGAIINILTPALTSTGTPMVIYQTLFYVPANVQLYTSVSFQNIIVTQPAPCNIAAYFDGQTALADSYANNLWVGPTNEYNNFFTGIPSTNAKATAYNFNGYAGGGCFCGVLVAQQMYSAFGGNLNHVYIGDLTVQSCIHGIDITEGNPYGFAILGFDVQGVLYPIYFTETFASATIFIGGWQEEDYTANPTTTFPTNADIYTANNMLSLFVGTLHINRGSIRTGSLVIEGTPISLFVGPSINANSVQSVSYKQYLVPTIPANPPVSATVYQNTNMFDIRIYLPAYATTAGTAGSVTIALGASSTPPTIGTKFINGSTSSSATEIIELVVPMGFYYEFTATGVTFGTATVFPA
ncbi:MAG: hypothetical protein QW203_07975, partial [Thermoplasmatales archaeon]